MATVTEELKDLAALLEKGLITREQFEVKRDRLMTDDEEASVRSTSASSPGVPNQVGAYRILGHIGDGGMGTVYRGQHRSAEFASKQGGEVAVKVMHPHVARNQDFAERFEREAGLGLKLDHPGICKVHELIVDGGMLALVMELVEGAPLSDIIGTKTGPIPWERAWPMFEQLLEAVAYMHGQGVLHRDIKPENVLVTSGGKLKLLDLGIAKDMSSGKTKTGVGMGTVDYMAPEQHMDAGKVDERADVYALGMTLYEMLAGQLPWGGELDAVMVLQRKLSGQIPPPTDFYPDIAPGVVAALMSALATERHDRTASGTAMAEALRDAVTASGQRQRSGPSRAQQPAVAPMQEFAEDEPTPAQPTAAPRQELAEDEPTPAQSTAAHPPSAPMAPSSSSAPPREAPRSRGGRARSVGLRMVLFGLLLGGVITWVVLGSMGQPPATALDALERDLLQGMAADEGTVTGLYREACDDGYQAACRWLQERGGQRPTLAKAGQFFASYCEDDDPLACLVVGWSLTQKRPGGIPSKEGPDPGRGASLLDDACQKDYLPACVELGRLSDYGAGFAEDKAKAAELYRKACDGGNMRGCSNLANCLADGKGVTKDEAKAAELYRKACDGGSMWGCSNLAGMYATGEGLTKDEAKAAELVRKACDGGYMTGCDALAAMYATGEGVPKDQAKAVELYRKACDGAEMGSCDSLAGMYATGEGVIKDEAKAAELGHKACDGDYMMGCSNLGLMYQFGEGIPKDQAKAVELYRKACDGGNMGGCSNLGVLYETGRGVRKDEQKAAEFYRKACDGADMQACGSLGLMYETGSKDVRRDEAKAIALYRKACDGGDMLSCTGLGYMYDQGNGVSKDAEEAMKLYRKACDGGAFQTCFGLGEIFKYGDGVPKDRAAAKALYRKACDGGFKKACRKL